jgi:hypothetical protein
MKANELREKSAQQLNEQLASWGSLTCSRKLSATSLV